jgi:hypothetical protein
VPYREVVSMCGECTFIEEEIPMIFESDDSDTPKENLLKQGCCGGSCACKK